MREEASKLQVDVSPLRSEEDLSLVLQYPQLVLNGDWPAIQRLTGVLTSAKMLQRCIERITAKGLTDPVLQGHGIKELYTYLRTKGKATAPAPTAVPQLPVGSSGVTGPLPGGHMAPGRTSSHHQGVTIDPYVHDASAGVL